MPAMLPCDSVRMIWSSLQLLQQRNSDACKVCHTAAGGKGGMQQQQHVSELTCGLSTGSVTMLVAGHDFGMLAGSVFEAVAAGFASPLL